jgi:hypothetical protein
LKVLVVAVGMTSAPYIRVYTTHRLAFQIS